MSLYNALFGYNKFAGLLLEMLGVTTITIPRFRDCYLSEDGDEIIIHTRTGGGNREYYESEESCQQHYPELFKGDEEPSGPWNEDLRAIPGYKYDRDDTFDATYANFHYAIPEAFREHVALLADKGAIDNPAKKWQELFVKLQNRDQSDPDVKRALDVGEKIMKQINEAFKKDA